MTAFKAAADRIPALRLDTFGVLEPLHTLQAVWPLRKELGRFFCEIDGPQAAIDLELAARAARGKAG